MDINHVHLQGCLGDVPKYFDAADGKEAFAYFSLATNVKIKGKNGTPDSTDTQWHDIVCFGWRADVARTFAKGARVDLLGYKRRREYQTPSGKAYVHEIVAQDLHAVVVTPRESTTPAPTSVPHQYV